MSVGQDSLLAARWARAAGRLVGVSALLPGDFKPACLAAVAVH